MGANYFCLCTDGKLLLGLIIIGYIKYIYFEEQWIYQGIADSILKTKQIIALEKEEKKTIVFVACTKYHFAKQGLEHMVS